MQGTLFVIGTPIGNLEDITQRAMRILSSVDVIACEDTRVSGKLFSHLGLRKTLVALHEHSGQGAIERIVARLRKGESVAYVSDAGTPGVNDPGGKLVAACVKHMIRIEPIPGVSALTTAISVCGFPMDDFVYVGFMPHKKGKETLMKEMTARSSPTVFLESTHRIEKTLTALAKHASTRAIFVGRELTKMHETLYRGTVDEVMKQLQTTSTKGEFVVIMGPA